MLSGLSGYIKGVKNALHGPATAAKPTLGRIRVGNRDIEEIKLISQGGYAYVFEVRDMSTGEIFALKKMICQSPERFETAKNEIRMLRSLPDHPNLLRVYDTSIENRDNCYYVYVLLEFCDGGSIFDLMAKHESTKLNEKQLIFIMREVCEGVKALHSKKPPIAHRDLKIENVLLRNKRFKLCDFGSCSTSYVDFSKIPQSQYATYEEEYEKNTTLMYRPPEMCDPYQRQIVCEKVDIWMLGCILYTMCFYKHPFQEMTKLSIVNAAYTFPDDHPYPEKLIDLIRIMLTPNPNYRPSIYDVCDLFNNYFDLKSVKLNPDAQRIREEQRKNAMEMKKFQNSNPRLKFDGDIPIEELMKLQKSLQTEDESPVHQFQQRGNGNRQQQQQQQPQQFKQHSSKSNHHHFDSFDSFGQQPKKPQQPELHQFNSSPGLHQSNTDWADFKTLNNNSTPKTNNQWNGFGNNAQPKPSSFSNNHGNQGNQGNQGWSNNQNAQPVKADNRVNEQWNNFNFNSTSSNTQTNNNTNNSANQWATSGWGTQNQQQAQNFNAFNSTPSNNSQANNAWNSFGANSNNNMSHQNNFQSNNNNMMNQPQKANTVVTNDLLDLADTSNNGKPNIMALYAMNR